MAQEQRCPTCGGAVCVVGDTTLHYEPVEQQEITPWVADLEEVKGLQAEIARLRMELTDCTRDCRKAGERFERALDLLCEVGAFLEDNQSGVTAEEMQAKVRAYLDSE